MPKLEQLNAQVQAYNRGEPLPGDAPVEPAPDPMAELVDAIRSIELQVEKGEVHDYSPAFHNLGVSLTKALKAHGKSLVDAIATAGQVVNVAAPKVSVAAPNVSVEPKITVPSAAPVAMRVKIVSRDDDGEMSEIEFHPIDPSERNKPKQKPVGTFK